MPAPRPKRQREKDLETTAHMYLRGAYQSEIAAVIGVTQATISNDIRELLKRWREAQIKDIDILRAREIERLNEVESAAWAEYKRSQQDRVVLVKETKSGKGESEPGKRAQETREGQCGDSRYLAIIKDCVAQRRAIFGLDAPTKVDTTIHDAVIRVVYEEQHSEGV
jgi:DNA-binding MarR family transcriptional regulator